MKGKPVKISVSDSIGKVSGEIIEPEKMKAMLVLAHGAGAGMSHPFMSGLSRELAAVGVGTLRFNFPFTEQKKKRPDVPAVAHKTIEAVIQKAIDLFPDTPLFAGGKSFGGRMTSQLFSKHDMKEVKGLVFVGFPLHAPGNPSVDRADHLQTVKKKMLFLQGTRDALAQWDLIEQVTSAHKTATLVRLEGADHGFKMGKLDPLPILAEHIKTWASKK